MLHSETPLTLTHYQLRRTHRTGACPILDITVTYPGLCVANGAAGEVPPRALRFNETYRAMAERLVEWGADALCARAEADFLAAGAGAVYCFDRRLAVCDMTANFFSDEKEAVSELIVTRTLRLTSRRGGVGESALTATDRWRWPDLTLCPAKRRKGSSVSI